MTSQWGQFVKAGELLVIIEAGDVGKLKSEFARSLFDWRFKERTVERYREPSDTIPMKQLLDAEGGLKAAKVAMLSIEQALVNLGYRFLWSDFANMSEDYVMLELRTLGFDGDFKKSIEGLTASSNLLPVRAPSDGVIIGNDASIGEAVSSENPFMEILDVSRVWIVLDVRKEDASTEQVFGQPILQVKIIQDVIARYGIAAKDILALVEAISGTEVGSINEGQYLLPLAARLSEEIRSNPDAIGAMLVASPTGEQVPLLRLLL